MATSAPTVAKCSRSSASVTSKVRFPTKRRATIRSSPVCMRDERDDLLASERVRQAEEGGHPRRQCQQGTERDLDVCGTGARERDNAAHPLGTFQTLLDLLNLLLARLHHVPCLCDVGGILGFQCATFTVEGVDMLHQMLFKVREPL